MHIVYLPVQVHGIKQKHVYYFSSGNHRRWKESNTPLNKNATHSSMVDHRHHRVIVFWTIYSKVSPLKTAHPKGWFRGDLPQATSPQKHMNDSNSCWSSIFPFTQIQPSPMSIWEYIIYMGLIQLRVYPMFLCSITITDKLYTYMHACMHACMHTYIHT